MQADSAAPGGSERVLLVDDEESIVRVMTRMLERLGFRATGCESAEEALEKLREEPGGGFDVVVTDQPAPSAYPSLRRRTCSGSIRSR